MFKYNRLSAFVGLATATLAGTASAQQSPFLYYVGAAVQHESNLLRLGDGINAIVNGQQKNRGDTVTSLFGGISFDRTYSQQQFVADISTRFNRYSNFTQLDANTTNANLKWLWAAGQRWKGLAFANQYQAIVNYADTVVLNQANLSTAKNINTYREYGVDANYLFIPDWYAGVGVSAISNNYTNATYLTAAYNSRSIDAKVTFQPATNNKIIFDYRHTSGTLGAVVTTGTGTTDQDYKQNDLQVQALWVFNPITQLDGYIGYTSRTYPVANAKNYSGVTGRLTLTYNPTTRVAVPFTIRHELGARIDAVSNFVVTDAASVIPTWYVTEKVQLNARLEYLKRNYVGDPYGQGGSTLPTEAIRYYGVGTRYDFSRNLWIGFNYLRESRNSADPTLHYLDNIYMVTGRFTF